MDIRIKIREWLLEDFGGAPLQYEAEKEPSCVAELRSKSDAILACSPFFLPILEETQNLLALGNSQSPEVNWLKDEGASISKGELLAHVSGQTQTILKAERTALNLCRISLKSRRIRKIHWRVSENSQKLSKASLIQEKTDRACAILKNTRSAQAVGGITASVFSTGK